MKIQVRRNSSGRAVSIDLTDAPLRPTPREADAIIAEISTQLRQKLGVVKLSGYWILGDMSPTASRKGWCPLYGHRPGQQTRSFDKLIREGLQVTTVRSVPVK